MKKFILLSLLAGLQVGEFWAAESKDDGPVAFSTELLPAKIQEGLQLTGLDIVEIALEHGFDLQDYINCDGDEDLYDQYNNFIQAVENKIVQVLFDNSEVARFKDLLIESIQEDKPLDVSGDAQLSLVRDVIDLGWLQLRPEIAALAQEVNDFRFQNRSLNLDNTLLKRAIKQGQYEQVLRLIALGADVHDRHVTGYTPLHAAAMQKNSALIEILLQKGADIEAQWVNDGHLDRFIAVSECDNKGVTPLHVAIQKNNIKMVALLLVHKADINKMAYTEYSGRGYDRMMPPLFFAIDCENYDLVQYLLNNGAQTELKDRYKRTALIYAVEKWSSFMEEGDHEGDYEKIRIIEALLQAGADINACDDNGGYDSSGYTALMIAAEGNRALFRYLLDNKHASPIISYNIIKSALLAYRPYAEIVENITMLVERHGDLLQRDAVGNTLLHAVVSNVSENSCKIVQFLQSQGLDIKAINNAGETLLHAAGDNLCSSVDTITYLCNQDLDVNQLNYDGQTPIIKLVDFSCGRADTFFALLDRGATIHIEECDFRDIIRGSDTWENLVTIQRLLDLGANPHTIYVRSDAPEIQAIIDAARSAYDQTRAQIEQNLMSVQDNNVAILQSATTMPLAASVESLLVTQASLLPASAAGVVPVSDRSLTREELRAAAAQAAIERQEKATGK